MYIKPDIEESISELKLFATGEKYDTEYTDYEIFNMAIEALEKQIAKKTIKLGRSAMWDYGKWTTNKCICGRLVLDDSLYCDGCGQKLDWK